MTVTCTKNLNDLELKKFDMILYYMLFFDKLFIKDKVVYGQRSNGIWSIARI